MNKQLTEFLHCTKYFVYAYIVFSSFVVKIFKVLNEVYKVFDERIKSFDVYKVESINEKYMVASGVPSSNGDAD